MVLNQPEFAEQFTGQGFFVHELIFSGSPDSFFIEGYRLPIATLKPGFLGFH